MKYLIVAFGLSIVALIITGCAKKPEDIAQARAEYDQSLPVHHIVCYSGGQKVYEGESVRGTLRFYSVPASSINFLDKESQKWVTIVGDCIVTRLSPNL